MATLKMIWNKKKKTASIWAFNDYIVTIVCDFIVKDGPVTNVTFEGSTVMATSNNVEIVEVAE